MCFLWDTSSRSFRLFFRLLLILWQSWTHSEASANCHLISIHKITEVHDWLLSLWMTLKEHVPVIRQNFSVVPLRTHMFSNYISWPSWIRSWKILNFTQFASSLSGFFHHVGTFPTFHPLYQTILMLLMLFLRHLTCYHHLQYLVGIFMWKMSKNIPFLLLYTKVLYCMCGWGLDLTESRFSSPQHICSSLLANDEAL